MAQKHVQDTLKQEVILVTCDSQLIKAVEVYTFDTLSPNCRCIPPVRVIKYLTKDGKEIHHICQVEDFNYQWRSEKEKRINNPAYN